jgi:phenylalanine-4-hydroxylase
MRQNLRFLSKVAYGNYLEGLDKTGITIDSIPQMYGMNRILKDIGWAAVAVDGFIPPQAFMEFQAYKILVIAADIRNVNHIEYTPAPDILHEAAGHAPIIAHKEYAEYLELFGKIGAKAFSSKQDYALYEAIRHLSIIKEDPSTPLEDVKKAEKAIEVLSADMGKPSEMALLRNLHWWTVEYGLIGTPDDFKLYGAGLLSSIGESQECLKEEVKKLPYSIDAQNYSFDITNMQPQLFVAKDFAHMSEVLNEFADTMAFRKGGVQSLQTALDSDDVSTIEFETGLQLSGKVDSFSSNEGIVEYIKISGAAQLSTEGVQLEGHGIEHHAEGYSSPIGFPLLNDTLADNGFNWLSKIGETIELTFKSGIKVKGELVSNIIYDGKTIMLSFANCTATLGETILFDPTWGMYDIVLAEKVVSTYYGPSDPEAFKWEFESPKEKTHKLHYSEADNKTFTLYETIRSLRESKTYDIKNLTEIKKQIESSCSNEWLLKVELLELAEDLVLDDMVEVLKKDLKSQAEATPELKKVITDALIISNSLSTAL